MADTGRFQELCPTKIQEILTVRTIRWESPWLVGHCLVLTSNFNLIFQIYQIFNISYCPQFNLSFQKKISLSQNSQKSPKNLHKTAIQWLIKWDKQRDLALLETGPRYWQKGHVKRRQDSLYHYPRIKKRLMSLIFQTNTGISLGCKLALIPKIQKLPLHETGRLWDK